MRHNKILAALFPLALVLFFASYAYAASPGTNATLEFVENFTSGIGDRLLGFARSLFVGLATLSLALGLGKMILSGESNIGSVAAHIAKWIIYVGVFFWIMSSSGVATFLPKLIVNSFMEAGRSIAGQDVAPDDLLVAGIRLYGTMVERGWDAGWGDFIGIMLIGIVILVVVAMLRLEKAVDDGLISAYYRRTILDMSKKVLENLAAKYKNVRKGVNDIMGGQVLEHEGKTIYNAGIAEGIALGEERGIRKANLETARRLREMGMIDNDIQKATNLSFDDISSL